MTDSTTFWDCKVIIHNILYEVNTFYKICRIIRIKHEKDVFDKSADEFELL